MAAIPPQAICDFLVGRKRTPRPVAPHARTAVARSWLSVRSSSSQAGKGDTQFLYDRARNSPVTPGRWAVPRLPAWMTGQSAGPRSSPCVGKSVRGRALMAPFLSRWYHGFGRDTMAKTTTKMLLAVILSLVASAALSQTTQGQNNNNQGAVSAPEFDPGQALGALVLLGGTLAIIRG